MNTRFILIVLVLISVNIFAQNAINYKALIKDANGNVLVSSPVSIEFTIYEGAALTNNVYQESHTANTDVNGFVIVNIGEGTSGDNFSTINWTNDDHFLNVQINTGSGLVDMGTTQFMAVPYALSSGDHPWVKDSNGVHIIDTDIGIGVSNPEAQLDVKGGDWNLDAGNPGDLRIGSASHNFRIGIATGGGGAGITRMYTNSNDLIFGTNNTRRITLAENGKIGLGNISEPEEELHLDGAIKITNFTIIGALNSFLIRHENINKIGFYGDFNEWGPNQDNTVKLGGSGFRYSEIWSVNPLNTSSDRRLKKDIKPINYGLSEVMNLKPVSYKWKEGKQDTKLGFIAQDVSSIVPEIVKFEKTTLEKRKQIVESARKVPKEDFYAMSYTELIPVLVKAIQELKFENDSLQKQIDILKEK